MTLWQHVRLKNQHNHIYTYPNLLLRIGNEMLWGIECIECVEDFKFLIDATHLKKLKVVAI